MFLILAFPDLPDEDRLLDQARQGNQQAVGAIYERYFDAVYGFIAWRVSDMSLAEDLTSEVFIRLIKALPGPTAPRHSLRGWLFRVARHVLHDHYREAAGLVELDEYLPAEADSESQVMQNLEAERVRQAVRQLAPEQQEVLALRFGQMFSLEETAASLGKSIVAVKSLQFRAINALRQMLGAAEMEAGHGH